MSNSNGHDLRQTFGLDAPPWLAELQQFVANTSTLTRQALLDRFQPDRRRNLEAECGWPAAPTVELYQRLFNRDPLAARVVEVMPLECWQVTPSVYEDEDSEVVTPFEEAWDQLGRQIRPERSYFAGEKGSAIWDCLRRATVLSGIGHYGVVLLGLDDGRLLSQPAAGFEEANSGADATRDGTYPLYSFSTNAEATKGRRLLFVRACSETDAKITRWETNPTSPRFCHPVEYQITVGGGTNSGSDDSTSMPATVHNVHWSRVVHISKGDVLHIPEMQQVLDSVLDARKVRGGSAEMYWKGAFPGYSIETKNPDTIIDKPATRDAMEQWWNGLQRALLLEDVSLKSHPPQVVDPSPQIKVQIDAICIKMAIPERILMGSERGKLASTQDQRAWEGRVSSEQMAWITPKVVVPFIDRLIALGVLLEPKATVSTVTVNAPDGVQSIPTTGGYSIWWPPLSTKTEEEKATAAQRTTEAIARYVQSGAEKVMTFLDFLVRILGWDEEDAQSVVDNGAEERERREAELAKAARRIPPVIGPPPPVPPPFGKATA